MAQDEEFVMKSLFRAFLHLTKEECEEMPIGKYYDYKIVLRSYINILHLPYKKDD
jgi:hypothetical protein